MANPPDRDLALAARRGDPDAFGELVRRHQASVFNVCYRLTGNAAEAEDQSQETFLRAYRKLALYDPNRPFGPWVRRVATNLCYNHLQKRRPVRVALEDERDRPAEGATTDPATIAVRGDRAAALRRAITTLPPHYRAVIELRHFQGLSYTEIADTLGQPLSNVKSHLFRARRQLERSLREEGWGDVVAG
jgi:RNA polymerase sigma-70 factor (ECF subfamily)